MATAKSRRRNFPVARAVMFALAVFSASSCAHAVRIISVPEGATIAVDGKSLGVAPILYQERSGPPGWTTVVQAQLQGYGSIARREPHKICPTSANLLLDSLGVGFLFGFCMRDEYVYDFTVASAPAVPPTQPLNR
jgi:hypothetical protein